MIAKRTKDGLAAAKARGVVLGNACRREQGQPRNVFVIPPDHRSFDTSACFRVLPSALGPLA